MWSVFGEKEENVTVNFGSSIGSSILKRVFDNGLFSYVLDDFYNINIDFLKWIEFQKKPLSEITFEYKINGFIILLNARFLCIIAGREEFIHRMQNKQNPKVKKSIPNNYQTFLNKIPWSLSPLQDFEVEARKLVDQISISKNESPPWAAYDLHLSKLYPDLYDKPSQDLANLSVLRRVALKFTARR